MSLATSIIESAPAKSESINNINYKYKQHIQSVKVEILTINFLPSLMNQKLYWQKMFQLFKSFCFLTTKFQNKLKFY